MLLLNFIKLNWIRIILSEINFKMKFKPKVIFLCDIFSNVNKATWCFRKHCFMHKYFASWWTLIRKKFKEIISNCISQPFLVKKQLKSVLGCELLAIMIALQRTLYNFFHVRVSFWASFPSLYWNVLLCLFICSMNNNKCINMWSSLYYSVHNNGLIPIIINIV